MTGRDKLACYALYVVAFVVGGRAFFRLFNAAMAAAEVEMNRQKELQSLGLPLDPWTDRFRRAGDPS